jgi:hypothetical protein
VRDSLIVLTMATTTTIQPQSRKLMRDSSAKYTVLVWHGAMRGRHQTQRAKLSLDVALSGAAAELGLLDLVLARQPASHAARQHLQLAGPCLSGRPTLQAAAAAWLSLNGSMARMARSDCLAGGWPMLGDA